MITDYFNILQSGLWCTKGIQGRNAGFKTWWCICISWNGPSTIKARYYSRANHQEMHNNNWFVDIFGIFIMFMLEFSGIELAIILYIDKTVDTYFVMGKVA